MTQKKKTLSIWDIDVDHTVLSKLIEKKGIFLSI